MEVLQITSVILLGCAWLCSKVHAQIIIENDSIQTVFKPFEFAYQSNDGLGTTQHRKENGNENGLVRGSYGFTDPYGIYRAVDYVADNNGFRSVVKTNEPGTANQNPADSVWLVQSPPDIISPPPNGQGFLRKISFPAQISPANFTLIASPSAISSALFSSLQNRPTGIQYPYPVLARPGAVITLPVQPTYNREQSPKFLTGTRKFTPRTGAILN